MVTPVVHPAGQGCRLPCLPLRRQCSRGLSEGIVGWCKRRRFKVTRIGERGVRKDVRPMVCKSLDDDPCFKVNGSFDIGNGQLYYLVRELVDVVGCLGDMCRDIQAMSYTRLIPVSVAWDNQ